MNVKMRKLPRFFADGNPRSFGSARSAYRWLAKKRIAREFDVIGRDGSKRWDDEASKKAFLAKWCEYCDESDRWWPKDEWFREITRVTAELMKEDGVPHVDPVTSKWWKPDAQA